MLSGLLLARLQELVVPSRGATPGVWRWRPDKHLSATGYRLIVLALDLFPLGYFASIGVSAYQFSRGNLFAAQSLFDEADQAFAVAQRFWPNSDAPLIARAGLYRAVLLDLYSRKVVGWAMGDQQNRQLVLDALTMAIHHRRPAPGLIHHTDQGVLYACSAYRAVLATHGMIPSMSRKGDCYDNAVAASFFSNLKNELTWHHRFYGRDEARAAVFDYIEVFYNRQRLHQTLDYVSPVRYEEQRAVP